MTSTQRMSAFGARAPRKEDHRLLTGRGRFGSDVQRTKMLHARVIRSSVAHASGLSIDASAARALPGVVEVVTAADLPGDLRIPVRLKVQDIDLTEHLQPVLAGSTVRYVGEPVAVVLAEDAYLAEDAAELVTVEFAREEDIAIDAARGGTVAADFTLGYGDVDKAFAEAGHVVKLTFDLGRHTAVPMEPRALVVDIDSTATSIEIFGATKVPVFNQTTLAGMLGWDPAAIRMHAVDAGGGFGVRGEFYPEDFLIPWLAIRSRRPVSWIEDRAEHLVAVNHSRQQHHRIEVALTDDGTILGLRDDVVHDNGAYARTHGIIVPELTLAMLPGPYRVPAYEGRVRAVLTNKTPCGTYRAPGRFEGTTVREQLIDVAADQLGIDRVELRRRNLLRSDELPHRRPINTLGTDVVLDAGDYAGLLDKALARVRELGWQQEVDAGREAGRTLGLGVVMFLEKSGLGPHETADVEVTRSGRVRVHSGGTSLGQGIETALAQVVADVILVDLDRVDVVNGDTLLQPFGTGSWASRSTVLAGNAVHGAGREVAARMVELTSRMLEVSSDDLELVPGAVQVVGVPGSSATYAEIAAAAQPGSRFLQDGEAAGLSARYRFSIDHMTYPYGAHVAVVEIDPGTGGVKVLRYLVAYEVGRAVNPALVEDQLRGGVAQGVGGALFEEFRYDENGQPLSATFMDYLMPTAVEIPEVELVVCEDSPATTNPLGVRGAGEGGLTAAGAALVTAVRDALGGVTVSRLPMTPDRVLEMMQSAAELPSVQEAASHA
jgi:aerobic carbon-monoxide dehydrogenase large subunit